MRLLFLSNNTNSFRLIEWLTEQNVELFFSNSKLDKNFIESISPDLTVSFNYKYIIGKEILNLYPNKFLNLHISYLPYNRGANPNLWSFIDGTPKGVTIHLIDEGIDTGDILFQKVVNFDIYKDTLSSTYRTLIDTIIELFIDNWKLIREANYKPIKQSTAGSIHYKKDFEKIKNAISQDGYDIPIYNLITKYNKLSNV